VDVYALAKALYMTPWDENGLSMFTFQYLDGDPIMLSPLHTMRVVT